MTQYMRPVGSPTVVGWTGLAADVADTPGTPNDLTYIASPISPTSASYWDCALSAVTDPNTDEGLVLRFRPVLNASGGDAKTNTVRIYRASDNTTIVSYTTSVTGGVADVPVPMSPAQAALITSYGAGAVRVRVSADGGTLGTYTAASTGAMTAGLALARGVASSGIVVGGLATQNDVKTRWDDGSIRFVVLSCHPTTTGPHALTVSTVSAATFTPVWPTASVTMTVGGTAYTATLPAYQPAPFPSATDVWLNGPIVRESRVIVTPTTVGGTPHPSLRVIYDVRSYAAGGHRVDVTVSNTIDAVTTLKTTYNASISVAGSVVYTKTGLVHYPYTRWRKTFTTGLTEATWTEDFALFQAARALPIWRPDTANVTFTTSFEPLSTGLWDASFAPPTTVIGLFPAPVACYSVHRTRNQRDAVLSMSDSAGSWSMHVTKADGVSKITIDEFPSACFQWIASSSLLAPEWLTSPGNVPDLGHHPDASYPAYLLTGDRWHYDEMTFVATWALAFLWPNAGYHMRDMGTGDTSKGVAFPCANGLREPGWLMRTLGNAAAYTTDSDPLKAYFTDKLTNNLTQWASIASADTSPLGTTNRKLTGAPYAEWGIIGGTGEPQSFGALKSFMVSYLMLGAYWAQQQLGVSTATPILTKLAALYVTAFSGTHFARQCGAMYTFDTTEPVSPYAWRADWAAIHTASHTLNGHAHPLSAANVQAYLPQHRLMQMIGEALGVAGCTETITYLMTTTDWGGTNAATELATAAAPQNAIASF